MAPYPPQHLECPDPANCPVPSSVDGWTHTEVVPGSRWYRVYDSRFGYDAFNPGFGDTRFAPFDSTGFGDRVPTMYLAGSETAALVETIFHRVDVVARAVGPTLPTIYARHLREKLLAHVTCPQPLTVADLRDPALAALGLTRPQVVATSAEHYPCTRRLAREIHADVRGVAGIVWNSRQIELATLPSEEVVLVFGDRAPSWPGSWKLTGPGARNLYEGPGRDRVEALAKLLGVGVEADLDPGA